MAARDDGEFRLSSLGLGVYLPTFVFMVGEGAILPVVVASARDIGASLGLAGVLLALIGIGQILGDLPAGLLAARIGERASMAVAGAVSALGMLVALAGLRLHVVGLLALGILVAGMAGSTFALARQSYLTAVVPFSHRARALSTLGGAQRVGLFVGPFLGAAVITRWGHESAYWVQLVAGLVAGAAALLARDLARHAAGPRPGPAVRRSLASVVAEHGAVLGVMGSGVLLVGLVRASRQAVIPLWASHIGLDATQTSIVFGLSGAVDMLLFYPAGKVMDRFGRAWVVGPSMALLGLTHVLLPWHDGFGWLLGVALAMGFANGIGSGIIMTLGADVAPADARSEFLGAWRLLGDSGNALGPVVLSAGTALWGLGPAAIVVGLLGFAASAQMVHAVHRFVPHRRAGGRAGSASPAQQGHGGQLG